MSLDDIIFAIHRHKEKVFIHIICEYCIYMHVFNFFCENNSLLYKECFQIRQFNIFLQSL